MFQPSATPRVMRERQADVSEGGLSDAEQQRRRNEQARDDDPEGQAVACTRQLPHHAFEALQIEDDPQLTALDRFERLAEQDRESGWRCAEGLRWYAPFDSRCDRA